MTFDRPANRRKYYQEHKERAKLQMYDYRIKHPEFIKNFMKDYNQVHNPINNPKKIMFKGKQKFLGFNPRKGICQKCNRKVGEEIKRTHLHHITYHEDDPLRDTIELCASCHRREHTRK